MDPLTQAIEALRQLMNPPASVSNMTMIRHLVAAEYARLESPPITSFIPDDHREFFECHGEQMQAFLQSQDGGDAWGLLVEAFRSFVELPAQVEQPQEGLDEE